MESVPLCFRIIRGGDLLGLRGGGSQSVGETPGGIPKQTRGRRKEKEGRKSGKGMIMKYFKASLLFVPPLARPIGGGTAERRDGEGEGREMLEEELTS